jgi:hypothetical protein
MVARPSVCPDNEKTQISGRALGWDADVVNAQRVHGDDQPVKSMSRRRATPTKRASRASLGS